MKKGHEICFFTFLLSKEMMKILVPHNFASNLFLVVLYRVQVFRVRVEYESEGVEYESSTSRVLRIHSQKWGSSPKIWCFESNKFHFLLHFY